MTTPSPTVVLRALRPRQWVKNVLVAAAPIAAGKLDDPSTRWRTLLAFVVFTAAASATYLVNDVADKAVDSDHPTKRLRPIAAGELSTTAAYLLAGLLGAGALVAAWFIDPSFAHVLLAYLAVNAWYSSGMKHVPVAEMVAVASGFVFRAVGGGAATDTPLSLWFVVVVSAGSMLIVVGKRSAELQRTEGNGGRDVLQRYSTESLRLLRVFCAAVGVAAYGVWVVAQDVAIGWLAAVSLVPFALALARYSWLIDTGHGEEPEHIVLADRLFQLLSVAWLVIYGLAVYG